MDAHEIHAIHDIYIQYTYKLSIASRTEPIPNAPQFRSLLSTTPHMSSQLLGLTIIIVAATAILTQFQGVLLVSPLGFSLGHRCKLELCSAVFSVDQTGIQITF